MSELEKSFHQTRRMFYVSDTGAIIEAPRYTPMGHAEWFALLGVDIEHVARGYYRSGYVALYQGASFAIPRVTVQTILTALRYFQCNQCWLGLIPANHGEIWQPMCTFYVERL